MVIPESRPAVLCANQRLCSIAGLNFYASAARAED